VKPLDTVDAEQRLINPIPLYNFYAAAGSFSEMQSNNDFTMIAGPDNLVSNNDYFACKISGESMNRVIPNGSICLFKMYNGGSRNGKIVLVENSDIQDPDFNSAFTIKTYSSEIAATEDSWKHTSIVLRPNSYDSSFKDIVLKEEDALNMRVVGEFVKILE
jgi:SOS-response transcriptional repressor LexA